MTVSSAPLKFLPSTNFFFPCRCRVLFSKCCTLNMEYPSNLTRGDSFQPFPAPSLVSQTKMKKYLTKCSLIFAAGADVVNWLTKNLSIQSKGKSNPLHKGRYMVTDA